MPQRYNKTPPPRTRQGTAPTTPRSSRMPTSLKRTSWGSATHFQQSSAKEPAGMEAVERRSESPDLSYHGTDSGNSSLRSLRQKPPPTFVDHRDSLVLNPIQQETGGTRRGRGLMMPGVDEVGSGGVRPTRSTTSVNSEGFGSYLVTNAAYMTLPTPLPSMSKDQAPFRPRASTSSELLQGLDPEPSPPPTATHRFAGPSNPRRLPSRRIARPDCELFPEGQQPIFSPK